VIINKLLEEIALLITRMRTLRMHMSMVFLERHCRYSYMYEYSYL
jgi:hypothetical protein